MRGMDLAPIDDAVDVVARRAPGIAAIYLFGSAAQDRTHRESDLDVAVLFDWAAYPTAVERFEAGLRLAADCGAALGRNDVDLLVLNDAPPTLARAIVSEGRRLYLADAAGDHAFRRDAMLRAADLEPWLRRLRRRKLDRLPG